MNSMTEEDDDDKHDGATGGRGQVLRPQGPKVFNTSRGLVVKPPGGTRPCSLPPGGSLASLQGQKQGFQFPAGDLLPKEDDDEQHDDGRRR